MDLFVVSYSVARIFKIIHYTSLVSRNQRVNSLLLALPKASIAS